MTDTERPPDNLILQALHAIRKDIAGTNERLDATRQELSARLDQTNARLDQTNARLDQTNARLDETNARLDDTNSRLDDFSVFTVQKLTDLDTKVDRLSGQVGALDARLDNLLTGQLGKDVRELKTRVSAVEERLGAPEANEAGAGYGKKPPDEQ